MSTSFSSPSNEWDSDIDDSNSSEEFMYVKGDPDPVPVHSPDMFKGGESNDQEQRRLGETSTEFNEPEDMNSVWKSHEDKVPVSSTSSKG